MPQFYLGNWTINILSVSSELICYATLKTPPWLLPLTTLGSAAAMMGVISAGYLLVDVNKGLPDVENIRSIELKIPLRVYSSEGLLISEFGNERRKPVALEDTPQALRLAVLASEDDRFYEHRGIDVTGLARAALSNFRSGATQQGASTITMQVARNFFLTREKTYLRKLREVLLAFKLEQILSKDEILHLYLNKIFLGHRAYGFGAAAEVYYGRTLGELTLAEVAMLAGLPKAPSSNNPLRNPSRAITRRNYVLGRMLELGHIDQPAHDEATTAPTTATKHAKAIEVDAPHIAEMVRATIYEQYGEEAYWAGLKVHTTIKALPQSLAEKSLRKGLQDYDRRHGYRGAIASLNPENLIEESLTDEERLAKYTDVISEFPNSHEQIPSLVIDVGETTASVFTLKYNVIELQLDDAKWARRHLTANRSGDPPENFKEILSSGDVVYLAPKELTDGTLEETGISWRLSQLPLISGALISIEPSTGKIHSLVGGYDFFLNKFNRAVQSVRQPGSNIKPFIYSAAMDRGFTPATLISGAPIVMTDPTHGTVWRPENYSGKFFGPTRMREGLARSMNLVSIRLLRSIGIPYTREYLERFGIDMNRFSSSLTMALGSGGITPLELLSAYGVIANGGYRVEPYFIDHIINRNGELIFKAPTPELCDECYADYLPEPTPPEGDEVQVSEPVNLLAVEEPQIVEQESVEVDLASERSYVAPRVMNRANNFLITSILRDVVKRGTARKALVLEREDIAGKTGTTNDYVDAWFSGFNSKVATTVWIGFDDPVTMGKGEAGSKAALPIWIDYMRDILKDTESDALIVPEYMEAGWVNRATGERTDELDPTATAEFFPIEALLPEPFGELGINLKPLGGLELIEGSDEDTVEFDEYGNEILPEEAPAIEQNERIIEDDEETQGLF